MLTCQYIFHRTQTTRYWWCLRICHSMVRRRLTIEWRWEVGKVKATFNSCLPFWNSQTLCQNIQPMCWYSHGKLQWFIFTSYIFFIMQICCAMLFEIVAIYRIVRKIKKIPHYRNSSKVKMNVLFSCCLSCYL
jgi:hypothetical protein